MKTYFHKCTDKCIKTCAKKIVFEKLIQFLVRKNCFVIKTFSCLLPTQIMGFGITIRKKKKNLSFLWVYSILCI